MLRTFLVKVDLDTLNKELRRELAETKTELARAKIIKRLKVVESILSHLISLSGL